MSKNNPHRTVNVSFGNSVMLSLNETQIKYICLISAASPERELILELISYNVNAEILQAVSKVIKKRSAFIKIVNRYEFENEKEILGELLTISKLIDILV